LKATQANLEELNHVKSDLEEFLKLKESEIKDLAAKVEDRDAKNTSLNKKLKELQVK
jgi:peptidoglycan hydrolase CwlO-like protein